MRKLFRKACVRRSKNCHTSFAMSHHCMKKYHPLMVESSPFKVLKSMGYSLGKTIGEGTYSKVCIATTMIADAQQKVACKIINKKYAGSDFIKRFLPRELKYVRLIEHPNIVNVFKIIEMTDAIYLFMDYCHNGDLLEYVRYHGPISEDRSRNYFRQLVRAVEYLHELDIAHRDLKCENVLLTINESVKLTDFGFARGCRNEKGDFVLSDTFCGSAAYAAPEILQGISYDPKMYDIWAMGCILCVMLAASMPFDDSNIRKMLKCQLNRTLCVSGGKQWMKNSSKLNNLISCLLEPDVSKRATIQQVSDSAWLQKFSFRKCKRLFTSSSDTKLY